MPTMSSHGFRAGEEKGWREKSWQSLLIFSLEKLARYCMEKEVGAGGFVKGVECDTDNGGDGYGRL